VQKVLSAEAAGASAVIIFDSVPEPVIAMGHAGGGSRNLVSPVSSSAWTTARC
jgi:hypothetical protein